MSKNKSLNFQVKEALLQQLRIGQSKHAAKISEGTHAPEGIFSWGTYHDYLKHSLAFAYFAKSVYSCRTLEDAKQYVSEYIALQSDKGSSAWTIHLQINALAKLYRTQTKDFTKDLNIKAPRRLRSDIKRSRTAPDNHYSEANHQDVADFGRGTGFRRRDLLSVKKKDFYVGEDGNAYIHIVSKGGKPRDALVLPEFQDHVYSMICRAAHPDDNIFRKDEIPCRLPEHAYRAEYAKKCYMAIARPLESLSRTEKYFCRADKKGVVYDKAAMLTVSRYLGHDRIDVIAYSYLY